jgi:glutaconate CoA-transferase subunit A
MAGEYFSDEDHLRQWLQAEKEEAQLRAFLKKYIYGVPDFAGYLERCGGMARIQELRALELLQPTGGL